MADSYICVINSAWADTDGGNPPTSRTGVYLTDSGGTFSKTWFTAVDEVKREILAVALASISTKIKVYAIVDTPVAGDYATRWQIYHLQIVPG